MKGHVPFKRANEMRALLLAALATFGGQPLALRVALGEIGPYASTRKSRGAQHRSKHRVAMDKRAALKARNRKRNK